jgi:signal transduction histidine kinase
MGGIASAAAMAVAVPWFRAAAQSADVSTAGQSSLFPILLVGAVAALVVAGLLFWFRHRLRVLGEERARLKAELATLATALDSAPDGFLLWRGQSDHDVRASTGLASLLGLPPGRVATYAAFGGCLSPTDRELLDTEVQRLRGQGAAFDLTLRLTSGERVLQVSGRRARGGDGSAPVDLLWFRDVTDYIAAIATATRARNRLEAVLDNMPMPVWTRDADLRLTYCNEPYARIVDGTRESVIAEGIEIGGGVIADNGKAVARRAQALGTAQSESQHLVVGGDRRLFDFVEQPLGKDALLGYALDMTGLENTQAELARHIAAHAEVLEHLGTGIVIYGPDSRVKFFNTAYLEQFGLDEDFLGSEPTMGEVLEALRERRRLPEHADFPSYKRELVRHLTGIITPQEELLHLPNGSTLRMVAAPHPFGGVLITYEDVTDTLALERSYNTLIEVQRETLDNLYEGIAVYGSDGRLKLSNPAFARMWGLAPEELQNEPHVSAIVDRVRDFFGDTADWETLRDTIISRVSDRESRGGRIERSDGSVLDYATVPLPDGGCLLTYVDVTDSIRAERALRERNAALETADRLKSEFIANVSYELRTPLNAIIGFAEILDHQYFGSLNERQVEYSRGIVAASQRLLSLINDILDIATIEAGYMQLELTTVDLGALLSGLQMLVGERARNRELTLEMDCQPDIGTVVADERRLKQAIYNLISNAIKFTPQGGRITVSARRENGEIVITVADTGIGIAPEHQARVFEKFAQVGAQGRQGGAGLGLALVKSLIELHGGSVALESEPDSGTRVICRIPARAEPPTFPADGSEAPAV